MPFQENQTAMTFFIKSLWTGAWIFVFLAGNAMTNHPLLPGSAQRLELDLPLSTCSKCRQLSQWSRPSTFTTPPEPVSIASLLNHAADYHQRLVAVRGHVTQPELHLDESELFINFVFRLADGDQSVVVFGRHDRTQGAPSISLDLSVEVIGVFWKERDLNSSQVTNTIEALSVAPYPSLIPENA